MYVCVCRGSFCHGSSHLLYCPLCFTLIFVFFPWSGPWSYHTITNNIRNVSPFVAIKRKERKRERKENNSNNNRIEELNIDMVEEAKATVLTCIDVKCEETDRAQKPFMVVDGEKRRSRSVTENWCRVLRIFDYKKWHGTNMLSDIKLLGFPRAKWWYLWVVYDAIARFVRWYMLHS